MSRKWQYKCNDIGAFTDRKQKRSRGSTGFGERGFIVCQEVQHGLRANQRSYGHQHQVSLRTAHQKDNGESLAAEILRNENHQAKTSNSMYSLA